MIEHVYLRNFQSWRELDIDLAPITVFVGRGNSGKSAILRAIRAALTNQGGEEFVRHGVKSTSVVLSFDDDTAISWLKPRGKGATYLLDTGSVDSITEFTKTGTSVPQEILDVTRVRGIEIDKGAVVYPQLHRQWDTPFIIGESGSRIARILGKLTKLDVLVQAQILCRRDKDEMQRHRDSLAAAVTYNQEQLDALPNVDALQEKLLEARAALRTYQHRAAVAGQAADALLTYRAASIALPHTVAEVAQALEAAGEAITRLADGRAARAAHARAVREADEAVAQLTTAGELYHELCGEAGVCETCPWK